jgi:uncharacterized surface protein with fasciclin (FAS1) repeats
VAVAACDDDNSPTGPQITQDIVEIAAGTPQVSTLVAALTSAGLVDDLQADGPFTVFAPVNTAFDALGADVVASLLEAGNADLLTKILTFHVIPGAAVFSGDLSDGQTVTTLQGETLTIGVTASGVTVNGASVTTADVEATNGVIHLIDGVLTPELNIVEKAILTSETQTLVDAVVAGGLASALQGEGPFTVFAPVNSAFAALDSYTLNALLDPANQAILSKILRYHVVSGTVLSTDLANGEVATLEGSTVSIDIDGAAPTVNGASVVAADIEVANGVIHLVDGVLLPELDIVETATITEQTSTLAAAVTAGGLVSTLQGDGPFTVFAPVNAAFEALGTYAVSELLDPVNQDLLAKVLTYHVVPGTVLSTDLANGEVATAQGSTVTINIDGAAPTVNGAAVVAADIQVANGVIHLIDGVLTENLDVVERATITEETDILADAIALSDLVPTLQGEGPFTVFAPVNAAFEALDEFTFEALQDLTNQAILQKVLTYHVVPGTVLSTDLANGEVATAQGSTVTINIDGAAPTVNGAAVVAADIQVANGVIHLIDGVLLPEFDIVETAALTAETSTLAAAVAAGDLVTTLQGEGPFTVFAPLNAAFAALGTDKLEVLLAPENQALLQKVLTYHVVPGTVLSTDLANGEVTTAQGSTVTINIDGAAPTVNGATVVAADIQVANGVIHLIDGVLTENLDLVDVAGLNGFSVLTQLVDEQGLTSTLRSDNGGAGFTVFAPTNVAATPSP